MKLRHFALIIATLGTGACSRVTRNDDAFAWSENIPAGATVHLRDGMGNITVNAAPGRTASVRGALRSRRGHLDDVHFVVNRTGNDYYICAMWRNSGECNASGYRGSSSGPWWTIFSLFHHGSDAAANITMQLPSGTAVDARTLNGIVTIDGANAGVSAHTVNGAVRASNVSGPLMLSTVNGEVRLAAATLAPSDSVHLSTVNGAVHAELPPNLDGEFDLSVTNGVVRNAFPIPGASISRHHISGQIGTSTRVIRMHTVNGAIVIDAHPNAGPATGSIQ